MQNRKQRFFSVRWFVFIITGISVILLIKFFAFETYYISSTSMYKTLLTGDLAIVNKFTYGARLSADNYHRLKATGEVKRNDIIVFNYPAEHWKPVNKRTVFIKRCIALPGDTFFIYNNDIYINNKLSPKLNDVTFNYFFKTKNNYDYKEILNKFGINEGFDFVEENMYSYALSENEASILKKYNSTDTIYKACYDKNIRQDGIFPFNKNIRWNADNYGPLVIPQKGSVIKINKENIIFYERIISIYENNKMQVVGDSIYINDIKTDKYTFKYDYYFVLGDNRHNSEDSRFWGFLPENHIIGKATEIVFSFDSSKPFPENIRWDRICKLL